MPRSNLSEVMPKPKSKMPETIEKQSKRGRKDLSEVKRQSESEDKEDAPRRLDD